MKQSVALLTLLSTSTSATPFKKEVTPPCRKFTPKHLQDAGLIKEEDVLTWVPLPTQHLWNDVEGVNYLTEIKNQHIPSYCGSCWAQAATSVLSDRIKILRKAAWPDINISPQQVISCSYVNGDNGCHGGDSYNAFIYMNQNQVTDETCSIYRARGHDNGEKCSQQLICDNCTNVGKGANLVSKCWPQDNYKYYHTNSYGHVSGEENMLQEIFQRGPIACGIVANQALLDYKGGIFHWDEPTTPSDIDHDISVVGFGVGTDGKEKGVNYWLVRNSWGSAWGEDGFFRVVRGSNNIQIEYDCAYATALDTWTNDHRHKLTTDEMLDVREGYADDEENKKKLAALDPLFLEKEDKPKCRRNSTMPKEEMRFEDVPSWEKLKGNNYPDNLDWRNHAGQNWLSWNKNQHIPTYCGSCWAQGTTSSFADRWIIHLGLTGSATPVGLNAQYMINHAYYPTLDNPQTCEGGDPLYAWKTFAVYGVPDSSCTQYVASDFQGTPGPKQICKDCTWPPCDANSTTESCQDKCWATVPNRMYYADKYYNVVGKDQMMAELTLNGPIECGIQATPNFDTNYNGGIYHEVLPSHQTDWEQNHAIAVVGWGLDEGTNLRYWIGRNSWGTYWGEGGFFRMIMDDNDDLGITQNCTAGTVGKLVTPNKKESEERTEIIQ